MIEAAEKEGYDVSPNDLRDEIVTFFSAGHESNNLNFFFFWEGYYNCD